MLLLGGMGLLAAKSFAELRQEEQRPAYNFGTFATATALSALSWPLRHRFTKPLSQSGRYQGQRPHAATSALALGMAIGITNIVQIELLLRALVQVSGTIAFPLTGSGHVNSTHGRRGVADLEGAAARPRGRRRRLRPPRRHAHEPVMTAA